MELEFLTKPTHQKKDDLQVVFVNDFNDEYHVEVDQDDELYQKVRMIRRRYKETYDYQIALNLASLYFSRLFDKYGGKKRFYKLFKAGLIKDYIPPHPKMKYHSRSIKMLNDGILLTKRRYNKPDYDVLLKLEENMPDRTDSITYGDKDDVDRPKFNKLIHAGKVVGVKQSHAANMTLQSFEDLFLAKREQNFSTTDDGDMGSYETFETDITITDVLDPEYEDLIEEVGVDLNAYVKHGTGFVRRGDLETVNLIERLAKSGWDPKKVTRKMTVSKNILNITKGEKKKKKKNEKRKQQASSSLILGMAGADGSHNSYDDFEKAMLSFTRTGQ